MNRKIYIPILLSNLSIENRQEYVEHLSKIGADFVFIAIERDFLFSTNKNYKNMLAKNLKNHIAFFTDSGFEVGVWIPAFGFGNALSPQDNKRTKNMTKIKSITGKIGGDAFCPEDPKYMEMYCELVRKVAQTGTNLIMIDDDLCLSVRPGIGCFCERHISILENKLGRKLNPNTMAELFFTGEANEYRRAFLDVMGDTIRNFCEKIRKIIDDVNPDIRAGFCAGYTSWDLEGVNAIELTRILAGKNKPFLRFTGAPYWVAPNRTRFPGQRLHAVIDFARAQEKWCENTDIEYFSEADSFPRPRFQIPASLIECFDAAMVASNNTPVLKYLFDYYSPIEFENGYERAHLKNSSIYNFLQKNFSDKTASGIKVNEKMCKFANLTLPKEFDENATMYYSLPCAAPFLTQLGIPVCYEENAKCEIAFGENIDEIQSDFVILDLVAALKLKTKGVDVGIKEINGFGVKLSPLFEIAGKVKMRLEKPTGRYYEECVLNDHVEILSNFDIYGKELPAVIKYNNGKTNFLIFMFDAYSINPSSGVFCSYVRQEQINNFYSDYPVITKTPFVYQLFKKSENEAAIFFANIFEDEILDFKLKLPDNYQNVECCGATATLNGNILHITSTIPAYGMFAVKLS